MSLSGNMMTFVIFANSGKIKKIEVFAHEHLRTFLAQFTYVHIFIQMSDFLDVSCPGVKIWWFSSFSENFWQIKRIEVFAHHRPGDLFGSVHTGANFLSKWVNFYIFIVLEWKRDDFLHFGKQLKKKSKKLKFSPIADLRTSLAQFTHVYIFLKMSEFLYFICPWVEIWLLS